MQLLRVLLAISPATSVVAACTLPGDVPSNTISDGFAIRVQNGSHPEVDGRLVNQWEAGGGDQHLYLSPAGAPANDLTLVDGILTQRRSDGKTIRAVINGEYTAFDNTTKMFMTERGDPRAIFDVRYACDPDRDGVVQTELVLRQRQGSQMGGHICTRDASGNRHELRYSPPGNTLVDNPSRLCIKVALVVVKSG